jgi:peptide/nickel transport system permease protein
MKAYVIRRFIQSIIILFLITTIIFFLFRIIPSNPTAMLIDSQLSPEDRILVLAQWGLDKPLYIQYLNYIKNLLAGSFGVSFFYRKPVFDVLMETMLNTLTLMGPAMFIAFFGAIFAGSYLGWKRGKVVEKAVVTAAIFFQALPLFWIGIAALMVFSYWLGIFPTGGMRMLGHGASGLLEKYLSIDFLRHLVLPLSIASLFYMVSPLLIMRTSMLEVRGEDFLEMAVAKGFDEKTTIRHCARNALLPIVTHAGIMSGHIFGGQVLLETVFTWPGMGRALVQAVMHLDYPVAQAAFFIMAGTVVFMNFIIDILYGYLDPRIVYK